MNLKILKILLMKQSFLFLWIQLLLMPSVRAYCYDDKQQTTYPQAWCEDSFKDCTSCLTNGAHNAWDCAWCPATDKCAESSSLYPCEDNGEKNFDWCPVDQTNPAFDGERCLDLSWELYSCTQKASPTTQGCSQYFLTNYCERWNQGSQELCNGQSVGVINPNYLPPFGRTEGTIVKDPSGVRIKWGIPWHCFKLHYDYMSNAVLCTDSDASQGLVLKYTLAPSGTTSTLVPTPVRDFSGSDTVEVLGKGILTRLTWKIIHTGFLLWVV